MSIIDDVKRYEDWLATQCDVVKAGLDEKHERMAGDPFKLFRATCFRFARKLFEWLPKFKGGPLVMSVGDAHIENWGTWRDEEGRLVWGVNDFDEAAVLPYTCDLVRLATSARLAPHLPGINKARAEAIVEGYRRGLKAPSPYFIDDRVPWMQALVNRPATNIDAFRTELSKASVAAPSLQISDVLREQLPAGTRDIEFRTWQRGGGSLGRPRFLAIGTWNGGGVVREAKALVPSAWERASGKIGPVGLFQLVSTGRYRSPDPFLKVRSDFVVRRIASDSQKIDLSEEDAWAYGPDLLEAMGADLAAIHLGGKVSADDIRSDLDGREPAWLHVAAKTLEKFVLDDFERWKDFQRSGLS
ncbi:DUF2252 family protein [Rhizobium phaseoli]|uniref:DUF2252 family protein n=1 Tax=Rhizobium phaseoli TaxID=396 RepID=UPI0007E9EB4B|nr:DUF2252 family protein [Rhizobium phaseoli]ANL38318.1 hypothetical protein AMC89_PD00860 [Rhizobium phaseoli]ANM02022.1 hypothetical protein AMC79_PD00857 [Rhizobium phaseoli]